MDLGNLQKKGVNAVRSLTELGNTLVENTVDDVHKIIKETKGCLADIDQIRIRVMHRAIQYQTGLIQSQITADLLPVELIVKAWEAIAGKLPAYAPPVLYKLYNPQAAVWEGAVPDLQPFDAVNDPMSPFRTPYLFIHGNFYKQSAKQAYSFYEAFEKEARMFRNDVNRDYSHVDIYILSYDSDLSDELERVAVDGLASAASEPVTGDADLIFLAVLWQEMVRRSEEAGGLLVDFFHRIVRLDSRQAEDGRAISHSLGNFALAKAALEFLKDTQTPVFNGWWAMAPAMPADAFTNTGSYTAAPAIAGVPGENRQGTLLFHSRLDLTLSYLYPLANKRSMALGVTGALEHMYPLQNIDTTACTGPTHGEFDGYFRLLGKSIRSRLGTELWPGLLCDYPW